ncbi:cysteine-rich receptor-like protein kinase 29 [Quercus robur]|uniref:cysteine-rich receptor-like protein kinase 29 n=1 Tax=Quercus robur TaxID=38942 RepID=UPI002161F047|nr:cysteine-rich receptor-like protein kinase 29 [Quercus robur]
MFSLDNSRAFLLLSLVVIVLISSCNSETLDYNNWNCRTELRSINETKDYYYKSNLTDLLDTLSIKSLDNYSFHNDTSSNGVIYGLFLCRGDFSSNDCQRCVGNLRSFTNRNCSSGRRSITWLEDQCMIRYSDINFFGVADTEYFSGSLIGENYSSPADAKLGILDLMTELVDEALKSDKLFKAGNRALENGNGFVYGSVQCTRDLNSTECSKCLKRFMKEIRDFCEAGIDCKVLASSCLLRYANSSFIEQPPVSPSLSTLPLLPPSPSQRPPSGNGTVLMQGQRPIAFHSQFLKGRSLHLPAYEEFLTLVKEVKKWRPYLLVDYKKSQENKVTDALSKLGCLLKSGYMAPEYAMFGQFSIKSDVFSFGVLILEIVSGQKITSFCNEENTEHLLIYAWKNWREGTISNLIDLTLSSSPITEIMRIIHIGLLCVQENVADRPNMASVVLMINSNSIALTTPTQPASFMRSNILPATSLQQDIGSNVSVNKVSITELSPR